MGLLQDKVCIVTGGAGSIGLASAARFIAEGAAVMLVDRSERNLASAAERLRANGTATDRIAVLAGDVAEAETARVYVAATLERWGRLDVLFSNAGNTGVIAPLDQYPEDVFDDVLRVHVRGAFLACKYALPHMSPGGSIIITSSVAGLRGDPGVCAYITAKHAQIGLMRSVSKEAAARRVRVNTIHPGPTDNAFQDTIERNLSVVLGRDARAMFDGMIPLGRHAQADEIAAAVLFLAGDQSSFMTGSLLVVDGGMST
ncbi:MAG TPA: SDR family NAD(P)-dependent oxidoreductase [Povalibacter sp.]|nr:SDR family NAD(P)-dependent oxidoreductase [Povalibacter sp.]